MAVEWIGFVVMCPNCGIIGESLCRWEAWWFWNIIMELGFPIISAMAID